MNVPLNPVANLLHENLDLQALIGDATRSIATMDLGFSQNAAPTDARSLEQATQTLHQHLNETQPGGSHSDNSRIYGDGILSPAMHGISRADDGSHGLIVTYSFGKNEALRKYEAAPFGKKTLDQESYKEFSAEERKLARQVMDEFEATTNIRYVEVENPEDAYISYGSYDLSKRPVIHEGLVMQTAAFANFPNEEGAYVINNSNYELTKSNLRHELLHVHGGSHSFLSAEIMADHRQLESYNATNLSYGYVNSRKYSEILPDSWVGGNSRMLGFDAPQTLQELDIEFLQCNYGLPPERPARAFILDANNESFFGTFPTQQGDKFELKNSPEGLLDFRGEMKNSSLINSRSPMIRDKKSMFWLTDTPEEVKITNSSPVIVMGDEPSHLVMKNSYSNIIAGKGALEVTLGKGDETIMATQQGAYVILTDFDIKKDKILHSEAASNIHIGQYNEDSSVILLQDDQKNTQATIIVEGRSVAQMQQANIAPISQSDIRALINEQRPAIEITAGDNGELKSYDSWFHAIQYNDPENLYARSAIDYRTDESGREMTDVTLNGLNNEAPLASFSVEGKIHPNDLQLFTSGRKVVCIDAKYREGQETEIWTQHNTMALHYQDKRHITGTITAIKDDPVIVLGANSRDFISQDRHTIKPSNVLYINKESQAQAEGSLTIELHNKNENIAVNFLDASKDKIYAPHAGKISHLQRGGKTVFIIEPKDEQENNNQKSYLMVDAIKGDIESLIAQETDFKQASNAPIVEIEEFKKLKYTDKQVIFHMEDKAETVEENIDTHFPDLNTSKQQFEEQAKPLLPSAPAKANGGKGR